MPGAADREPMLARSAWDRAVLSPLSLALLADSGWYHLEWDSSTPLSFGRAAGCEVCFVASCMHLLWHAGDYSYAADRWCD